MVGTSDMNTRLMELATLLKEKKRKASSVHQNKQRELLTITTAFQTYM